MIVRPNLSRFVKPTVCMGVILLFLMIAAGCTQQSIPQVPNPFPAATTQTPAATQVTVTKPDASHIVIKYLGGTDMQRLIEIEATVTDSQGKSSTQHISDKLATSPITIGGSIKFEGSYAGTNKVFATGYYLDGSSRNLIQTSI